MAGTYNKKFTLNSLSIDLNAKVIMARVQSDLYLDDSDQITTSEELTPRIEGDEFDAIYNTQIAEGLPTMGELIMQMIHLQLDQQIPDLIIPETIQKIIEVKAEEI